MNAPSAKERLFENMKRECDSVDNVDDLSVSLFDEDLVDMNSMDLNWILIHAVKKRYFKIVRYFVRADIKVGRLDESTGTAIHIASEGYYRTEEDRPEVVGLLFNIYDHVNYTNKKGLSHFDMACLCGNVDMMQWFIDQGVDVNHLSADDSTPLHSVTHSFNIDAVIMLLSNGADLNGKIWQDFTPLNLFCLKMSLELPIRNHSYWLSTIQVLLQYNSDVNTQDEDGNSPLLNLFYDKAYGMCPAQQVALEMLLNYNVDLAHVNKKGKSVLHLLPCWKIDGEGMVNVEEMYFRKSDPTVIEVVKMLLQRGADVNIQDHDGNSPLDVAISYCNYDVVEILLEHGACIDAVKFQGGLLGPGSKTLRNLEMTQNLLAIIALLKRKGFFMSNYQKLAVMKFLNGFDEIESISILSDEIELGYIGKIDQFIRGNEEVRDMIEEDDVYESIKDHLDTIRIGQMYLDPAIRNYLQDKLQMFDSSQGYSIDEQKVKGGFAEAKNTMINSSLSLFDLCSSSLSETYQLLKLCDYSLIVNSKDFDKIFFPIHHVIKGHITQSLIRGFFEQVAREANLVQLLTQMCLPYLCCENILKHLDNKTIFIIYQQYIHEL
ncbi:ankyrin-2-like [Trichogramma pretiosum]|uniref:ankyrin-2-like n=1 Tax=Trichogramma pretiosum TaxID=7493 RepID=UPI000C71A186|nr:ankyrin-2-like [Trichogramma pretiosum]